MPVVAVSGDDVIIGPHQRTSADGDAFLPDVQMQEAPHFSTLIGFQCGLFKAADAQHLSQEPDFIGRLQAGVDWC